MNSQQIRNMIRYTLGRLISHIGSGIQIVAIPLYILDLTGSGTLMGVFTMLSLVPALVAAPLSGVLGDRWNRKIIVVNSDYVRGTIVGFLALLAGLGKMNLPVLFACQVLISIMDCMFNAATEAMLPDLVEEVELPKANAAKSGASSLSMIVGPVLGGVIYELWGIKTVFFINAASFFVSAMFEAFIEYRQKTGSKEKLSARIFIDEIKEAALFVVGHKGLLQLFSFAMALNFILNPMLLVAIPYTLRKFIGFTGRQYGYLLAFFTIGLLLGYILLGSVLSRVDSGKLIRTGSVVASLMYPFFAFLLFPDIMKYFGGPSWRYFSIIGVVFFTAGLFNTMVTIPVITNLQKLVPGKMRSRFFSMAGLMIQAATPAGALVYGFLLDKLPVYILFSIVSLFILSGIFLFLVTATPDVYAPRANAENKNFVPV